MKPLFKALRRTLLPFVILHSSFVIAVETGDVFFQAKPAGAGPLTPGWLTKANSRVVVFDASGNYRTVNLGTGLSLSGSGSSMQLNAAGGGSFADLTGVPGDNAALAAALALKAPLASPTFTGTVTLPTGAITSSYILDGTIALADIAAAAMSSGGASAAAAAEKLVLYGPSGELVAWNSLAIASSATLYQLAIPGGWEYHEGGFTTNFLFTAPTANRSISVPNASGTVAVSASGNIALSAAGNITLTGTIPASNLVLTDITTVGTITTGTWSGSFGAVSGANLTTLNGSNISSGTVADARIASTIMRDSEVDDSVYGAGWNGSAAAASRNAIYDKIESLSGGTAIAIATAAWVETAGNGGNDGTGAIGDPAHPYATMAAAYTAGARTFYLGAGTFAGLSISGALDVNLLGLGRTVTTVTIIESTNSGAVVVRDLGVHSCLILTVGRDGANGSAGVAGTASSNITLENSQVGTIQHIGGAGGNSDGSNNAAAGGESGTLTLHGCCEVTTINHNGGAGGTHGGFADNGNSGGSAGAMTIGDNCVVGSVTANGGNGGAGDGGAVGGNGGSGAVVTMTFSRVTGTMSLAGGDLGTGGTPGVAGSCGQIVGLHCFIETATMTDGGGAGTISGTFVGITTISSGSPTISAVVSYIHSMAY